MNNMRIVRIRDVADVKGGKRLPKGKQLITEPNSHPYIRIRDLGKQKILELNPEFEFVDDETQQSIARYIVNKDDILISVVGTIGLVGIVGESLDKANQTENCDKITNLRGVDKDYLYYFLTSSKGQYEISKATVGAVQPKLPLKNIQDLEFPLPTIETQVKISSILNKIDEKIRLNQMVNNNLLQHAQVLYQKVFITDADTSWAVGHLSDLVTIKYGKDHKKLEDGSFPVYGSGGIMRYVERPLYDKESVLVPRKGTLNNVMYVNEPFWSVDTMFYTEMQQPNIAKFVFHYLKGKDLASMNAGSAVPSMTTAILNAMKLRIPDADTLKRFEELVSPMYVAIADNNAQSAKLAELRDTLLPKLMSGEIDVSTIEL
ncbi:restriction endonuclease subunit S [[Ruminococcus] torques]|uniref:restriction endonuclease subunit S n=1 Tax=[Ruminococcus] torques TaxID=33039 RepID=UPI001EE13028|nr:restriction endonuclease subunit S [[Ruminococcus] torques]MCG4856144.1 restriction endonuclease subunit S [[Ruminococcus] torques]